MPLHYEPLDPSLRQIRLLTLLPPSGGEINATLHVVSLDDRPVFDALSYVWGMEDDPHPVNINGEACIVRKNLKAALPRLQDSELQVIWIDAICIDQDSVEEKNHQLPLMRDIYMRASQVIVWLGEGDRYIDTLFRLVQGLNNNGPSRNEDHSIDNRTSRNTKAFIGYFGLFLLPYWQRMWTFQELALAESDPICVYGNYRCNLSLFISAGADNIFNTVDECNDDVWAAELANLDPSIYGAFDSVSMLYSMCKEKGLDVAIGIITARDRRMRDGHRDNLSLSIATTLGRKASDARDRVYALYGMDNSIQDVFPADYSQSNTLRKVVVETATWILEKGSSSLLFRVFGMRAARFSDNLSLPSWIPDFDSICYVRDIMVPTAEGLGQRSADDLKPITHDRDVAVLLGLPGVGVVAAGQSTHEAIPASFGQFEEDLRPWALDWLTKQGFDVSMAESQRPKTWEVIQLPAYREPKAPQVTGQSWHRGLVDQTQKASIRHLTRYFLGDLPPIRMTARNLGRCAVIRKFEQDESINAHYIQQILWGQRQLSSWRLTIQTIGRVRKLNPSPCHDRSDALLAMLQTAAAHELAIGYESMAEFWSDRNMSDFSTSNEAQADEEILRESLAMFIWSSAEAMSGLNAFMVDVRGKLCLGLTGESIEIGDVVIMPLAPYQYPLVLRREKPVAFDSVKNTQEETVHGTWVDLDWCRMVGVAFMQDLVEETKIVAEVVKQSVEDFYTR